MNDLLWIILQRNIARVNDYLWTSSYSRFRRVRLWFRDQFRFQGQPARHSFFGAMLLRSHGLPTPEPYGYIPAVKCAPLHGIAFFACHQHAVTLHDFLKQEPLERQQWVVRRLARLIANMHRRGIRHKDISSRNVLVEPCEEGKYPRLLLIDTDRVVQGNEPVSMVRFIRNMKCVKNLNLGLQHNIRFMKFYMLHVATREAMYWWRFWQRK